MKSTVEQLLDQSLRILQDAGVIPHHVVIDINVVRPKDTNHGDYTTNLALILAKPCGLPSRQLAELLVQTFVAPSCIARIEVASPGFINFFMQRTERAQIIVAVLTERECFGRSTTFGATLESEHPIYYIRPLRKLAAEDELRGETERRAGYTSVYEDSSTVSTKQITSAVEFPKRSIQYAHARISSVLRQLQEQKVNWDERVGLKHVSLLIEPQESLLISLMCHYPDVLEAASLTGEPSQIICYLQELANELHGYYNVIQLLCEQEGLRCARLCLLKAVRQVLRNGMQLLGVSAPESVDILYE